MIITVIIFYFGSRAKIGINTDKIKSSKAKNGQIEESETEENEIKEY